MKTFELNTKICKINEEQQLVYGWASVIIEGNEPVVDLQNDVITPEELAKAAHNFIITSRTAKQMHKGAKIGEVVESTVFTKEAQNALGINLQKEGWWIVMKIYDDAVWQKVKEGSLREFSIGGKAERVQTD